MTEFPDKPHMTSHSAIGITARIPNAISLNSAHSFSDKAWLLFLGLSLISFLACINIANATKLDDAKAAIEAGNFEQASRLYQALADEGDAKAQYNLGLMHYYGDGVKQDYKEAIRLYRLSANQGFSEAQYALGVIYFTNKITPANYEESIRLYRSAAEQGHTKSQLNLGQIYLKGEAVQQDYKEAQKWLTMAAQQGNGDAQFSLGNMYLHGTGVAEDLVHGYMWVALAADDKVDTHKNDTPSQMNKRRNMLRLLALNMPADQLEQAKQLVSQCQSQQLKACELL